MSRPRSALFLTSLIIVCATPNAVLAESADERLSKLPPSTPVLSANATTSAYDTAMLAGKQAQLKGDFAASAKHFQAAIEHAEELSPKESSLAASKNKNALVLISQMKAIRKAAATNNLAHAYVYQGKYSEAAPLFKSSLEITEKTFGADHPTVAITLNNMAELARSQNHDAEAEPLFKRALAILEKSPKVDEEMVAKVVNNLGALYQAQRKYPQSEAMLNRALAINEKIAGKESFEAATNLQNLAVLYIAQGQLAKAEPLLKRALAINEKGFGSDHPALAPNLHQMAELYRMQNKPALAEAFYKRALALKEKLGPNNPALVVTLRGYALLLQKTKRGAEAAKLNARADQIEKKPR